MNFKAVLALLKTASSALPRQVKYKFPLNCLEHSICISLISGWRIIILCSKFLGACLFNSLFIRQPNIDVQNLQWSVRGLLLLQPIVESRTQRGQIRFTIYSILCSLNRYFFKDSRHQNYKKKWFFFFFFFLSFSEF